MCLTKFLPATFLPTTFLSTFCLRFCRLRFCLLLFFPLLLAFRISSSARNADCFFIHASESGIALFHLHSVQRGFRLSRFSLFALFALSLLSLAFCLPYGLGGGMSVFTPCVRVYVIRVLIHRRYLLYLSIPFSPLSLLYIHPSCDSQDAFFRLH